MPFFGQVWVWSLAGFLVGALLCWALIANPARKRAARLEARLAAADKQRATAARPVREPALVPGFGDTHDDLTAVAEPKPYKDPDSIRTGLLSLSDEDEDGLRALPAPARDDDEHYDDRDRDHDDEDRDHDDEHAAATTQYLPPAEQEQDDRDTHLVDDLDGPRDDYADDDRAPESYEDGDYRRGDYERDNYDDGEYEPAEGGIFTQHTTPIPGDLIRSIDAEGQAAAADAAAARAAVDAELDHDDALVDDLDQRDLAQRDQGTLDDRFDARDDFAEHRYRDTDGEDTAREPVVDRAADRYAGEFSAADFLTPESSQDPAIARVDATAFVEPVRRDTDRTHADLDHTTPDYADDYPSPTSHAAADHTDLVTDPPGTHAADRHTPDYRTADRHSADHPAADRHSADRPGTDRHTPDHLTADRHSADRPGTDRHSADRPGTDRHSADRHAADPLAANLAPGYRAPDESTANAAAVTGYIPPVRDDTPRHAEDVPAPIPPARADHDPVRPPVPPRATEPDPATRFVPMARPAEEPPAERADDPVFEQQPIQPTLAYGTQQERGANVLPKRIPSKPQNRFPFGVQTSTAPTPPPAAPQSAPAPTPSPVATAAPSTSDRERSLFEPIIPAGEAQAAAKQAAPPAQQQRSRGARTLQQSTGGVDPFVPPGPFGPGSAMPLPGGRSPSSEYTIKASVTALRYCSPDSPKFDRTVAEVWFRSVADAERVGFRPLA